MALTSDQLFYASFAHLRAQHALQPGWRYLTPDDLWQEGDEYMITYADLRDELLSPTSFNQGGFGISKAKIPKVKWTNDVPVGTQVPYYMLCYTPRGYRPNSGPFGNRPAQPAVGEIYAATDTGFTYVWTGTQWINQVTLNLLPELQAQIKAGQPEPEPPSPPPEDSTDFPDLTTPIKRRFYTE